MISEIDYLFGVIRLEEMYHKRLGQLFGITLYLRFVNELTMVVVYN